jgi:plasmid stabilization system protein ParE
MSKANPPYVLTPTAAADIREIADWSMDHWGQVRTVKYLHDLHEGFCTIAKNHAGFMKRDYLGGSVGIALYPIKKHYVAFVPIDKKKIAIAAIIRQGRDIPSILLKNRYMIEREVQTIKTQMDDVKSKKSKKSK